MDGSSSQAERAAIVDRFSTDPSVAILLLTTRVGHLGLNLSAASMVVFLEHDWNPQVDLQVRGRSYLSRERGTFLGGLEKRYRRIRLCRALGGWL